MYVVLDAIHEFTNSADIYLHLAWLGCTHT